MANIFFELDGCYVIKTDLPVEAAAKEFLDALDVKLPLFLPKSKARVDTKRKLPSRRKT
ncbi:MAG: hypothetical protein P8010_08555 [Desulfosarcinaceae bacterium]|jgi:hypothetical protein